MKSLAISKSKHVLTGLRMSGIEGIYCLNDKMLKEEYKKALKREDIGILVIPQKDYDTIFKGTDNTPHRGTLPLVVRIPDGKGFSEKDFLLKRVQEAIGVSIE